MRDRGLRVYGRAVIPHAEGDTPCAVARVVPARGSRWRGASDAPPREAYPALAFTLGAERSRVTVRPDVFPLCALRAAQRDPRTEAPARRALRRWCRVRRERGER